MSAILSVAALRALETGMAAGLPAGALMERAGAKAGAWLDARLRSLGRLPGRVLVLCGPGGNGGDGLVCARHLRLAGHAVHVWAPLEIRHPDSRRAADAWLACGGTLGPPAEGFSPDLLVDALLGIGARRGLDGPLRSALDQAAGHGCPVVALDVPSGLDADRGAWLEGHRGLQAQFTLSFLAGKPGLYTGAGLQASGEVHVFGLGAPAMTGPDALNQTSTFPTLLQSRPRDSHKGMFGTVAVLRGETALRGASQIAARAALDLGAGRVHWCGGIDDAPVPDPVVPELMCGRPPEAQDAVWVLGCGMGQTQGARETLQAHLAMACRARVLDADALNLLACMPAGAGAGAAAIAAAGGTSVLTPHPAEAARLLRLTTTQVQADRPAAARQLARETRSWVVLKGAGSLIADAEGRCWFNTGGGPALATAGSGDALAGMVAALLAQCPDVGQAVRAAVWLHAAAASAHGIDLGLRASAIAPLAAQQLGRMRLQAALGSVLAAPGPQDDATAAARGQHRIVGHQHQG
jgi:hydroxyethylthiazole kinase-like uncharacterized protein yjeF